MIVKWVAGAMVRIVGGALIVVATLVALGALLVIALSQGWQRASLERALEAQLSRLLRAPVSVGSLEGPLYPTVVIRDLLVGSPEESLLGLEALELRWELGQVLPERRLVIKWMRLAGLQTVVEYAGEGSWSVPLPGPGEEEAWYLDSEEASGESWLSAVEISEISLRKAEILLRSSVEAVTHEIVARVEVDANNLVLPWAQPVGPAPVARVDVNLMPGPVGNVRLDRGALRGTLSEKGLMAIEASLRGDFGEMSLDGEGSVADLWEGEGHTENEVTVRLSFNQIDLHTITGRSDFPSPVQGGLTARGSLRSKAWKLEEGSIHGEGLELSLSAAGTRDHVESLKLDFRSDDLARDSKWAGDTVRLEGQVVGSAELRGSIQRPLGFINLAGSAMALGGVALGRLDVHLASSESGRVEIKSLKLDGGEVPFAASPGAVLRYDAKELTIEGLRLIGEEQAVGLSGTITRDGYRGLHVRAERLDVARIAHLASAPIVIGGRLDADLRVNGGFRTPEVAGRIEWAEPTWEKLDLDRVLVEIESHPGRLEATAWAEVGGQRIVTAEARLPIPESATHPAESWLAAKEAQVQLRGEGFGLGILAPFLPNVVTDPGGVARFDLALQGGHPEPRIEGRVELAEGSIRVPVLRQTFAPIAGVLRIEEKSIWLDDLEVGEPGEGASLSGRVALEGLSPTQAKFQLDLQNFPLSRSPVLSGNVDGQLRVSGSIEAPHLDGKLSLRQTRLSVGEKTDPVLKEIRIMARAGGSVGADDFREREKAVPTLFERASLKLDLEVPANTTVRGEGAELDIEGRVELRKDSLTPPRLAGITNVVRGSYRLQNRRFDVRRGSVSFIGAVEIDPVLDVEAAYRVSDVTIVAFITGHASSPTVRLESEPALPESDVFSYLIFGRPSDEIGASKHAGFDSAATQLAVGMAAAGLGGLLSESLPVETIDVKMQESGEIGGFEVGTHLTPDLFVRYGTEFGEEPGSDVRIEYRLNRHWSVATDVSTRGEAGGDVFWSYEY